VNEEGVAHYDDLIATMVAAGVKPVVTIFHWGRSTSLRILNSTEDSQIHL
jgi:beta-glucosidase/6-phospho-beta-glucosidase/beta-galactosidase